jgi:2-oxoacid:acceptor oxidoreductase delta subunit (pyruvate/2-ketoisovalerate family)
MSRQLTRGAWAEPGSSLEYRTGSWREERPVHVHGAAPCHRACPAGEDAQAWIAGLQLGDEHAAWRELVRANPLPAVTGRVCPHPCESACNRAAYDSAVGIHSLERHVGDAGIAAGWDYPGIAPLPADAPRVAIVGAGPAGLSAAWQLLRGGLRPVLFDRASEAGGLLRSAIPMTRLPRSVLDAELERLLGCGVEWQPRRALGRDFDLSELRADHAAVVLAPGCEAPRAWDVQGVVPADCRGGLEMLQEWIDVGELPVPKRVVIHGGGNTAMDIARVLKRHGAAEVHLVTASGLPGPQTAPDDVLNVVPRELEEGLEEGVVVHPHATVSRLLMRDSRVVGVEIVALRKLARAGGGKARVPFAGTERILAAEQVIPCIGEQVDATVFGARVQRSGYFRVDAEGRFAGEDDVFGAGDACGGAGTVAAAIGAGRRAAAAVIARVRGAASTQAARPDTPYAALNLAYYEPAPAQRSTSLPAARRDDHSEIESALAAAAVRAEAARCLSCGNCMACDNCWTLCPDSAVIKLAEAASDGSHYAFDYDYCKGCGLCAHECPTGYIRMEPEPL